MILYNDNGIQVTTIEREDKSKVVQYFSENDFNCDFESGALRPSNSQFEIIMNDIISGNDDESNIFVLKKNGVVIGYISMFVQYDRMTIGHIVVDKRERNNGYGKLLTEIAIRVAENEGRDVGLYCLYPNRYLEKLGFTTHDNIHYFRKSKGIKTEYLPKLFVSIEEYNARKENELQEELDRFSNFLDSDLMKMLFDIDRNNPEM